MQPNFSMEDGFYSFWKSLGPKPPTTLRCFERGEMMTLHDSDAILVATDYYKNLSLVKRFSRGKSSLSYVTVKKQNTDFLRHFLLKRQYRIEIYCSTTKCGRDNEWSLKLKASPGDLSSIEDLLTSTSESVEACGLSAVNIKQLNEQIHVCLAFCDTESQKFLVGEFMDSVHLANLETALVQLKTRECLVPTGLLSHPDISKSDVTLLDNAISEHVSLVFERTGVLPTEVKKSEFSHIIKPQDLSYFLRFEKENPNGSLLYEKEFLLRDALSCLGAIIKFLDLNASDMNRYAFTLEIFSLENHVRLDSAASRALHLLPGPDDKNKFHSVYGTLNNCRTAQGQRLLAQWLRQPLIDKSKIEERLDLVESFVEETGIRRGLHEDFLRRIPDLQRLGRRLKKIKGSGLQDVYRIYQAVLRLPYAVSLLNQYTGSKQSTVYECLITPLQKAMDSFILFKDLVESNIDLDYVNQRNEFIVRADKDPLLQEIRNKLDNLEERIRDEFRRCAKILNLEQNKSIKLESNELHGYFMRVTLKDEKCLRGLKTFEILDTQKGGVRFRNKQMTSLTETYAEVKQEYNGLQEVVVHQVVCAAATYLEPINQLNETTAFLDVIVSLAIAAISSSGVSYIRPKILSEDNGRIILKEARHPCLEMQDRVSVIPNDIHLERGKQIFLIITGPNMGGKSTYIHSVAVIVAMAQIGSFVPCSYAEIMPVDAIMARVGAADYQCRGVSTFLAEMLETSSVLRSVTRNSLVIIDELGRGTSTYDGFGLAWAVASFLASPEVGCFGLFATHFHELTSLAYYMPKRVANLRVLCNVSNDKEIVENKESETKVTMLYKVEAGVCSRSYGLDVARLAGLPIEVIKQAEHQTSKDEELESVWLNLDKEHIRKYEDELDFFHDSPAVSMANELCPRLVEILRHVIEEAELDENLSINMISSRVAHLTRELLLKRPNNVPSDCLLSLIKK
uniref:DNA_MISMATCH_REPAIR_2 domain-containing protein n=1 Tax=Schistosoma mansoni TaxID=6183 RepID=A0A5K4F8C7_SCHMA